MKLKINKAIAAIVCFLFLIPTVACGEENEPEKVAQTKFGFCESSRTVLREEEFTGGEFVLNTFRGDVESGQIIVTPNRDVTKFNFNMGELTREGGSEKLTADMFDVFAERYIEVTQSTSGNTYIGWYADALVPIKNYAAKRENKIKSGLNQGIWINLNVPKDAVPGKYTGKSQLILDDETFEVPMTVNIYNIDMPDEVHAVTSYWIDVSMISVGEGKPVTEELIETYYEFALSKRTTPRNFPGFTSVNRRYDAVAFAEAAVKYAKDGRVSSYALPYVGADHIVDYDYCEEVLTALAEKNVELIQAGEDIDLFKKAHYYLGSLVDEPTTTLYPQVRECDLRIQRAKMKVASSDLLKDYPKIRESLLKVENVITSKITEQLYGTDEVGGVQTWCPTIDHFSGTKARALALERMASTDRTGGESVWWYTCINPKNPYPTYHIDDDPLPMRLLKWMQYDYKVQGNLFWSMNFWYKLKNEKKEVYDLWNEALNYEGCNGDGKLMYPGSKYGVNGPISTLRLEGLRESAEDYELLWLAENGIKSINSEYGKNYDPDEVLENFYGRLFDNMFLKGGVTSTYFESVRCELMTLVEKIYADKTAAVNMLDGYVG